MKQTQKTKNQKKSKNIKTHATLKKNREQFGNYQNLSKYLFQKNKGVWIKKTFGMKCIILKWAELIWNEIKLFGINMNI